MKIKFLFYLFWTSSLKVSTKGTKVKPFEAGGTRFYENPGFDCNSSNQGMKCSLQARIQFTFGTNKTAPTLEPGILQPTDTDSGRDYFISSQFCAHELFSFAAISYKSRILVLSDPI